MIKGFFNAVWGSAEKPPTFKEKLCENLIQELTEQAELQLPNIKKSMEDIFNDAKKRLMNKTGGKISDINGSDLYDAFSSSVISYANKCGIHDLDDINEKVMVDTMTLAYREVLTDEPTMEHFNKSISLAKKISAKCKQKEINVMAMGRTQVGKTSLVKRLFSLDELKTGNGTISDTLDVRTYKKKINGVDLNYVDCPGFSDSRKGQDEKNIQKIGEYVRKASDTQCKDVGSIDIILFVVKIFDMADKDMQELLDRLIKMMGGPKIVQKFLVVVTHACSSIAPPGYFGNGVEIDLKSQITAWKKWRDAKKEMWVKAFVEAQAQNGCSSPINVPVVFMENHVYHSRRKINDVTVLMDGTPMLETFMIQIFNLIKNEKFPIMFMALAGKCPTPQAKRRSKKKAAPRQLTEQQTSLSRATAKVINKKKKENGWCVLF